MLYSTLFNFFPIDKFILFSGGNIYSTILLIDETKLLKLFSKKKIAKTISTNLRYPLPIRTKKGYRWSIMGW